MPRETETLKLLRTLQGLYKPSSGEVYELAGIAKLNKLYLAYLRRVGGVLRNELIREEAKYRRFMRNAVEVVVVLERGG
jgi:ABC-type transport system involved in cytochrome c biogenesis ATPase subunit